MVDGCLEQAMKCMLRPYGNQLKRRGKRNEKIKEDGDLLYYYCNNTWNLQVGAGITLPEWMLVQTETAWGVILPILLISTSGGSAAQC